jgi:hypothetical protein
MLGVPGSPAIPPGMGYDIDNNRALSAQVDGLLFVRAMLGFKGASLTNGISFETNALRPASADIESYLRARCGLLN